MQPLVFAVFATAVTSVLAMENSYDGSIGGTALPAWAAVSLIAVAAYLLKSIHGDLKSLTTSFHTLAEGLPEKYVSKSDYLNDQRAASAGFRRCHDRIDSAMPKAKKRGAEDL